MLSRHRRIDASTLPNGAQRLTPAALANSLVIAAGYKEIGFDHFAQPSDAIAIAATGCPYRQQSVLALSDAS
jgi:oxygen-independent coproporphyrinogen III oxidase